MKVSYVLSKDSFSGNAPDSSSFFLSNSRGGFLHLTNESRPVSKYNGLFFYNAGEMLRVVEDISLVNCPAPSEIVKRLYCVERKRAGLLERFFVPRGTDSLVYELSEPYLIDIVLDVRKAYDMRQWGRNYSIEFSKDLAVVRFEKKSHILEDFSQGIKEYEIFVALRHNGKVSCADEWVYRKYSYDASRNSSPSTRYVYRALKAVASRIVFSVASDRDSAVKEAEHIYNNYGKLLNAQKSSCRVFEGSKGRNVAYACAAKALTDLYAGDGMFAGLPWFFQFWSRDAAVCSRALMLVGKADYSRKILLKQVEGILPDGRTPNIFGNMYKDSTGPAPGSSADGIGWVCARLGDLLQAKKLSADEKKHVAGILEKSAERFRNNYERGGLIYNRGLETWMDTAVSNDTREGFRIEIQALQLATYRLLYSLTGQTKYFRLEKQLAAKVREKFWNGKILADGLEDFTPRPNAFIAAYIYPSLLSREEWTSCFRNLLDSLWLDWGGIATIDKKNSLFLDEHSGEPPYSYHRGDSWFWINNLAAIAMHRTDKKRFNGYIKKIYEASTNDILWKGALGCHSELSSAREQRAEGSLDQAWSSAMYIELVDEMKG